MKPEGFSWSGFRRGVLGAGVTGSFQGTCSSPTPKRGRSDRPPRALGGLAFGPGFFPLKPQASKQASEQASKQASKSYLNKALKPEGSRASYANLCYELGLSSWEGQLCRVFFSHLIGIVRRVSHGNVQCHRPPTGSPLTVGAGPRALR